MTEFEIRDILPLYVDEELAAEEAAEVESALADSASLRAAADRWRALRESARRGLRAVQTPDGLRGQVRASLALAEKRTVAPEPHAAGAKPRRWLGPLRIYGGLTAVAAAIVILLVLSVPNEEASAAPSILPDRFADIYLNCAKHRHRTVDLDLTEVCSAREKLRCRTNCVVLLPDLSAAGYEFDGVCECFGEPGVSAVHAYYRRQPDDGGEAEVVSFFTIKQRVCLMNCEECGCKRNPERHYQIAQTQGVVVCKWDDPTHSFAVCSDLPVERVREFAAQVTVARMQTVPVALASAMSR